MSQYSSIGLPLCDDDYREHVTQSGKTIDSLPDTNAALIISELEKQYEEMVREPFDSRRIVLQNALEWIREYKEQIFGFSRMPTQPLTRSGYNPQDTR